MSEEICYVYAPFVAKGDDSQRIVEGYVSSPELDLDQQIVDQGWLKRELPPWVARWGNIRAQHDPLKAVGKAQSVDLETAPGPYLAAKIVDDEAWRKVREGVYNGFSVGIKNPVLVRDEQAPNGRIVGGKLIEISIVDRPANDAAKFVLVKSVGVGEWKDCQTGATVAVAAPGTSPLPLSGAERGSGGGSVGAQMEQRWQGRAGSREEQWSTDAQRQMSPVHGPGQADTAKGDFGRQERGRLAASGAAMPDGSYPIVTAEDLRNAVQAFGRAKDPAGAKAHIIRRARALARSDLLPADWAGGAKDEEKMVSGTEQTAAVEVGKDADTDSGDSYGGDASIGAGGNTPIHPFTGSHSHQHDDLRGGSHFHEHMHQHDDMHEHPHCYEHGKDARLCAGMEHQFDLAGVGVKSAVAGQWKAAADVAGSFSAPALRARPAGIGGELAALLREALSRVEALADETDEDRDGDVDTPANLADVNDNRKKPSEQFVQRQIPNGTPVAGRETLPMSFASAPDLVKRLDALIERRLDSLADGRFVTKAAVADSVGTAAEVAKLAGGIAKGLESLATQAEATTEELAAIKEAVAEQQADLASVKELAQPVKGAVFAVEKGIGLDPDRINPDGTSKTAIPANGSLEWLAQKAAALSDEERKQLAAAMYRATAQRG